MANSPPRHPILVDTDALIAVANSSLWAEVSERIGLTTTNVCQAELQRHERENSQRARPGTREHRLHHGSKQALTAVDDDSLPLTRTVTVPRPHGEDAGEVSLSRQVEQYSEAVDLVVTMDTGARASLRRRITEMDADVEVVPPTYLFYILYDGGVVSKSEFCEASAEMIESEGWIGYRAVQAVWEGVPVDCSKFVSDDLLP